MSLLYSLQQIPPKTPWTHPALSSLPFLCGRNSFIQPLSNHYWNCLLLKNGYLHFPNPRYPRFIGTQLMRYGPWTLKKWTNQPIWFPAAMQTPRCMVLMNTSSGPNRFAAAWHNPPMAILSCLVERSSFEPGISGTGSDDICPENFYLNVISRPIDGLKNKVSFPNNETISSSNSGTSACFFAFTHL